jgi:hypothetical protein
VIAVATNALKRVGDAYSSYFIRGHGDFGFWILDFGF